MKKIVPLFLAMAILMVLCVCLTGCDDIEFETTDTEKQQVVQQTLSYNQATPTHPHGHRLFPGTLQPDQESLLGERSEREGHDAALSRGEAPGIYYPVL